MKNGDADLARSLADLGDIFIDDAFGAMHRAHASITEVPRFVESKGIGLLVEKELAALGCLLSGADRPYAAIMGGSKVSDKIGVIEALAEKVDHLFIGGAMAYTFLAAQGVEVGSSRIEEDKKELSLKLLDICAERGVTVHLPIDHVCAQSFSKDAEAVVADEIPEDAMGLDIGPSTVAAWAKTLASCKTIFWKWSSWCI